jgi:cell division protein FtsI/penicillin-binding protein 2
MAMGRSLNVVFARLAQKHLTPEGLTEAAGALGFGAPIPFVVKNEASKVDIPGDPLEFARSAAGFWHTSLSPLAGAVLAQTVANGGVTLKPRIVRSIQQGKETQWSADPTPLVLRRAIKPETAAQVTEMMVQTIENGSAHKTFHDTKGRAFLPKMRIAAKTGTLTRHKENRHYTWLVGFAPADDPEIAISALVVNTPLWRIKGPDLARDVMRAYFSKQGAPGVSAP